MESLDEISKVNGGKTGFFKHVFNFNDETKDEISNVIQYAILALIPIIILNKSIQKFVPEADDEKGSLELSAEIILQIVVMFLGIFMIHRIVTYLPTHSGVKYSDFSVVNIVLAILMITLSLQTKLGEKVSILVDRATDLWEGNSNDKKKGKGKGNVKVSQPISQSQGQQQYQMTNPASMGTTSINSLPPATQPLPDYNGMHQQDNTPLIGAGGPGAGMQNQMMMEPMAANDGGAFATAFGGW